MGLRRLHSFHTAHGGASVPGLPLLSSLNVTESAFQWHEQQGSLWTLGPTHVLSSGSKNGPRHQAMLTSARQIHTPFRICPDILGQLLDRTP